MGSIFVVLSVYYKHGEARNRFFTDVNELDYFLHEEIKRYGEKIDIEDVKLHETAIALGTDYVSEQRGWGIIEITEITGSVIYSYGGCCIVNGKWI